MKTARITIFAGHYGSGKTTLAVNYAIWLRTQGHTVALCDLDIVNPYFRTADAAELLAAHEIDLISSGFANTNVDAPAVSPRMRSIFDNPSIHAVIDLGGDDRGALALGRYAKLIRADTYAMWLVFNPYRPLTRGIHDLSAIREEIEHAAKVPFTGMVFNPNLGRETGPTDIMEKLPLATEAVQTLCLPLQMTAINRRLVLPDQLPEDLGTVFPIDLFEKTIWKI